MKYETLRKGLLARRERCLGAGEASWYKEEREKLEKLMEELEERHRKSNLSQQQELASIDQMLSIIEGLMPPRREPAPTENHANKAGDLTNDPDLPPVLRSEVKEIA